MTVKELLGGNKISKFEDINDLKNNLKNWNKKNHIERQEILKNRFINFFGDSNAN